MNIIIANCLALISSILLVISGSVKTKKNTLLTKTLIDGIDAFVSLILSAYTGMIVNIAGMIRNFCGYKNWLNKIVIISIWTLTVLISLITNKEGWLCLLPIASNTASTIGIFLKDVQFKWLTIFGLLCAVVYRVIVKNYIGSILCVATIFTSLFAIIRLKKQVGYINLNHSN